MTTEKRLIDAKEVKKKLRAVQSWFVGYPSSEQDKLARAVIRVCIDEVKKIKSVKICRCKDCKHYELPDDGDFLGVCKNKMLPVSMGSEIYPEANFFCAYGERKDNG